MPQSLVLIVDDEAYVTTVVGQQLQRRGHEVIVASDGEEALALAQERLPQLIISDFQMPVLSGLEMAKQLRSLPATNQIPLIMLTARGHRLSDAELAQTGIRCVLPKPFSLKELMAKAEQVLTGESQGTNSTPTLKVA